MKFKNISMIQKSHIVYHARDLSTPPSAAGRGGFWRNWSEEVFCQKTVEESQSI